MKLIWSQTSCTFFFSEHRHLLGKMEKKYSLHEYPSVHHNVFHSIVFLSRSNLKPVNFSYIIAINCDKFERTMTYLENFWATWTILLKHGSLNLCCQVLRPSFFFSDSKILAPSSRNSGQYTAYRSMHVPQNHGPCQGGKCWGFSSPPPLIIEPTFLGKKSKF